MFDKTKLDMLKVLYGCDLVVVDELECLVVLQGTPHVFYLLNKNDCSEIMRDFFVLDSNSEFLIIRKSSQTGVYNKYGVTVLSFKYKNIQLIDGCFVAEFNSDINLVFNPQGEQLLRTKQEIVGIVSNKYFITRKKFKTGYNYGIIDREGVIIDNNYDEIKSLGSCCVSFKLENKYCIYDINKSIITDCIYDNVIKVSEDHANVRIGIDLMRFNLKKFIVETFSI